MSYGWPQVRPDRRFNVWDGAEGNIGDTSPTARDVHPFRDSSATSPLDGTIDDRPRECGCQGTPEKKRTSAPARRYPVLIGSTECHRSNSPSYACGLPIRSASSAPAGHCHRELVGEPSEATNPRPMLKRHDSMSWPSALSAGLRVNAAIQKIGKINCLDELYSRNGCESLQL